MKARGGTREGFTLVETLVAIAVVAAVSVALQRGFVSTRQALARAEAVTAAEAVARDILDNRLGRLAREVGTERGEDQGLAFTVTSEPLDLPFPPPPTPAANQAGAGQPRPAQSGQADAAESSGSEDADADPPIETVGRWTPLRVTIRVEPVSGPPLVVETIHVAPAP